MDDNQFFYLRNAFYEDLDPLFELAKVLDTLNLKPDKAYLKSLIETSINSFNNESDPDMEGKYLFVLSDNKGNIIGTSMILAEHGTPQEPHVYYQVFYDQRYCQQLDKLFKHPILRLGFDYDGPTEIGGIVIDPKYRGAKRKLGQLLSYSRFLYIGTNQNKFKDEVLAELLPPLDKEGKSLLWQNLGYHFTGLDYKTADRLSTEDKDFIKNLFPSDPINASILGEEVGAEIGKVGAKTKPVEKMLKKIGFRYTNMIDPFDGGPHFLAKTKEISLIQNIHSLPSESLAKNDTIEQLKKNNDNLLIGGKTKEGFIIAILISEEEKRNAHKLEFFKKNLIGNHFYTSYA